MNLKEAFRFQNKLGSLMEEAQGILSRDANITRVENTYLRKKVFDGAENETVVDTPPTEFADRITDIVRFLVFLMEQREALSKAIRVAKNALIVEIHGKSLLIIFCISIIKRSLYLRLLFIYISSNKG